MKKISLLGGIVLAAGITLAILATASAGDVVLKSTGKGEIAPGQALAYFGAFANAHCPSTVDKVKNIRVHSIDEGYGAACTVVVSLTPEQTLAQIAIAEADDSFKIVVGAVDGDNFLVRGEKKFILSAAQVATLFASYAAAHCHTDASNIDSIVVGETPEGTFRHICVGFDTDSIEDARDRMQAIEGDESHQIEIVGRVVEE